MKKEGIQTRNRKLSSKGKRHRRNGENGNSTNSLPLQLQAYEKSSPFTLHGFAPTGFASSFQSPYVQNSNSTSMATPDSFMGPTSSYPTSGLSRDFTTIQPHASGFGSYPFGNGFTQFGHAGSSRMGLTGPDGFCQLTD